MDDYLARVWQEIAARPDGPLAMRFYLQPLMAIYFAVRDGLDDARAGGPAYFWAIFTDPARRPALLREGWRSVGKIFLIAVALDLVYQFLVLRGLRPVQGLLVAVVLALVPYVLLRGPANRIARRLRRGGATAGSPRP
ncbi:MAG TPA: hypothetical protein VFY16_05845 [Gemmatimonadaceae bacterium]|nr:hypothetical protein [Gemmatimonadaceae bacterium]